MNNDRAVKNIGFFPLINGFKESIFEIPHASGECRNKERLVPPRAGD